MRQLKRLGNRLEAFPATASMDLPHVVNDMLMVPFMPDQERHAVSSLMHNTGLISSKATTPPANTEDGTDGTDSPLASEISSPTVESGMLTIGDAVAPLRTPERPELVPSPLFYDNPAHTKLMADMLSTYMTGEKAMLVIGNQGVGKNKLVDRLLELLSAEREYVQLHRDTTLQSLTGG